MPIIVWTVAILALLPGVAGVAGAVVTPSDEPKGVRLSISATTERIPLPGLRGPVELSVDGLGRRLRIRLSKKDSPAALASRIEKHVGMLCPRVEVKDDGVELACRSRRIEAQITPEGKLSYLDINELRGLPWRPGPDAPPFYHYDPFRMGLGQSCPGKIDVVQGECEFKQGHALPAAIHFRAALDTPNRPMACVRLGDLAISVGDPVTASGWYRRAGALGTFGRIAEGRLCEIDGRCLATSDQVLRTFDPTGLPEPLRAESMLRAARAEAYSGRLPSAIHILSKRIRGNGMMSSICREGGVLLCRRILLEAMRAAGAGGPANEQTVAEAKLLGAPRVAPSALDKTEHDYLEELLDTYLSMPSWEKGPMAIELSQAAAPLAARLGAPGFGGNLIASLAPEVPDAQLSDHLLLATETFLKGQNWARARIVAEYAQTRLGAREKGKRAGKGAAAGEGQPLRNPRWIAVFRLLKQRADEDEVSPAVAAAVEAELAGTLAELKNARAAREKAESLLVGTRAARAARETETTGETGQTGDTASTRAPGSAATASPSSSPPSSPSAKPERAP